MITLQITDWISGDFYLERHFSKIDKLGYIILSVQYDSTPGKERLNDIIEIIVAADKILETGNKKIQARYSLDSSTNTYEFHLPLVLIPCAEYFITREKGYEFGGRVYMANRLRAYTEYKELSDEICVLSRNGFERKFRKVVTYSGKDFGLIKYVPLEEE